MSKREIAAQKQLQKAKRAKDRRESSGTEAIRRDLDMRNASNLRSSQLSQNSQMDISGYNPPPASNKSSSSSSSSSSWSSSSSAAIVDSNPLYDANDDIHQRLILQ